MTPRRLMTCLRDSRPLGNPSVIQKKKACGIRSITQIRAMNKALEDDDIKSMIALINYDGVGTKTMEGCFKMVMNYKKEQTLL